MKKISTLPVQNLVDNKGTSSAAPANSPDFDMLAKFQPTEPWEPVPPHQERMILAGCGILCVVILGLVGWLVYRSLI